MIKQRIWNCLPDKVFLKIFFRKTMGKKLNLKKPRTFNEKLQWLKLYNRNPEYTMMVDKYKVREYVETMIGKEYLIPLIDVWDDPNKIDFDRLPNQFVLKCNHNSGLGMCICQDKSSLNLDKVISELKKGLNENYYLFNREWPYKDVPRKIIAEEYIEDSNTQDLKDFKMMCFDGKVKCTYVCSDRFSSKGLHITFFDRDWNVMPFGREDNPQVSEGFQKPHQYDKMIELAEILSKNIPFVRVDFYEVDGRLYFGELTFFPASGFKKFSPEKYDDMLGDWIHLPHKYKV